MSHPGRLSNGHRRDAVKVGFGRHVRKVAEALGALALVAACCAGLVTGGPAGRAAADPIASCSGSSGVLVAVDFGHWGDPVEVGCAPASGSGYDAMWAAGFSTAGTEEYGQAFICRIGVAAEGTSSFEPTPADDPCVNTPPATACWSYWHADAGQTSWSYGQEGAMSYRPPPGSVDAWTFGGGNTGGTAGQPTFSPAQVRAAAQAGGSSAFVAAPAPPPTTAASTAPTNSAASSTTTLAVGSSAPQPMTAPPAGSQGDGASPPSPPPTTLAPTGTTTTSVVAPVTGSGGSGARFRIVASAGVRHSRHGAPGPPPTFLAGLVAVVVLSGAGVAVTWRRRQAAR